MNSLNNNKPTKLEFRATNQDEFTKQQEAY